MLKAPSFKFQAPTLLSYVLVRPQVSVALCYCTLKYVFRAAHVVCRQVASSSPYVYESIIRGLVSSTSVANHHQCMPIQNQAITIEVLSCQYCGGNTIV